MKNPTPAPLLSAALLLLLCLLPAAVCIGQENSGAVRQNAPAEPTAYKAAQADQAQKAEALRNVARKEYDVCLEHCAEDTLCMARCGKVYGRRLQRLQQDQAE